MVTCRLKSKETVLLFLYLFLSWSRTFDVDVDHVGYKAAILHPDWGCKSRPRNRDLDWSMVKI